ncbi:hypothetical protein HO173_001161 [Letharia columbiana]|uniref:Uncharacterized protein n=1 Tax=Letharia columbiana TaxID=112416 RepID=A0A8H6G4N8_9LECA|nr:uncharacterized protein HO173_001161 [Letharia columbiana]KAF6240493.1 hypothetical protein HO173_001161 [Letharia columbiana]
MDQCSPGIEHRLDQGRSRRACEAVESLHKSWTQLFSCPTFEWMFEEPKAETKPLPWTNFVEWLRHGDGIYWVNGKAGSGMTIFMNAAVG